MFDLKSCHLRPFSWRLQGSQPCQDEAESLAQTISCQKLIERVMNTAVLTFYEKHMASKTASGALGEDWKGPCDRNLWWEQHTMFSHETRYLDPWQSEPAIIE